VRLRLALSLVVAFVITGATAASAGSVLVESMFEGGAEHWQTTNGVRPVADASWSYGDAYNITDGHICSSSDAEPELIYLAPKKFLGNRIAAYKGKFSFKLAWNGSAPGMGTVNVYIRRDATTLRHSAGTVVEEHSGTFDPFDPFSVPLSVDGWQHTDDSEVTRLELKTVLRKVTSLAISIELNAPIYDPICLDKVKLSAPSV
jgi:hypothetical protein